MTKLGKRRVPRLLKELQRQLPPNRKLLLCVHKKIAPIAKSYDPGFASYSVAHWGAIDGKNDWNDYDTAVIFGLSYRDPVWATNTFFALQGLKDNRWLVQPAWCEFANVRQEMQRRQLIRQPCHAIVTPTLSPDGRDLAAVLATLSIIRQDTADLDAAVEDAFPGARLGAGDEGSWCRMGLSFPDVPRPFSAHELSDGTLKYFCLLAALMGYRLPPLIALNEPEASLHPSLLAPLARLIAVAAQRTRIWIVTHSDELASHLCEETGKRARRVTKSAGATGIEGLQLSGEFETEDH